MARLKAANNAITKLTVGITAADTSFTVEDAALFPDAPFRVTIDAEIMQVEVIDKLTNTFSAVQRGIEGTVAAPHNNGAEVANRWTAGYLETLATLEESQAMATMAESEAKTHAEAYADDVAATAETSAKTHATGLVGTLSSLLTTAKDNTVAAINEIFAGLGALETDVAAHKADYVPFKDRTNMNILNLAIETEVLKGAVLTGITANIYIETFQDAADVEILQGVLIPGEGISG